MNSSGFIVCLKDVKSVMDKIQYLIVCNHIFFELFNIFDVYGYIRETA